MDDAVNDGGRFQRLVQGVQDDAGRCFVLPLVGGNQLPNKLLDAAEAPCPEQLGQVFSQRLRAQVAQAQGRIDAVRLGHRAGLLVHGFIPPMRFGLVAVLHIRQRNQAAQQRGLASAPFGGQHIEAIFRPLGRARHPSKDAASGLNATRKMPARFQVVDAQRLGEKMAFQVRGAGDGAVSVFRQAAGLVRLELRIGKQPRVDRPALDGPRRCALVFARIRPVLVGDRFEQFTQAQQLVKGIEHAAAALAVGKGKNACAWAMCQHIDHGLQKNTVPRFFEGGTGAQRTITA